MRIFQVFEGSTNPIVPGNQTWYRNLYEPLIEMGHEVVLFDAAEGRLAMQRNDPRLRGAFSQKLFDTFSKEHQQKPFDLFFAYLMDGMVDLQVIDQIRKSGVPTCNFSCNNAHQFYLVDEISPHFDFNLHSEKDANQKFEKIGAHPVWWPMASNPKYFKPVDVPRTIQASFVGANYALRARYIAYLLENGVDAHAYGPYWLGGARTRLRSLVKRYMLLARSLIAINPIAQSSASGQLADHDYRRGLNIRFPSNFHLPVSDQELIALYSRSHISLGFLEVYDQHDPSRVVTQHLHLREFEAPMSGALYCTGYMDELAEMFEPDREVLVYRNQYELLDKVRYYLAHPDQAQKVRSAGRARALAEHTYHHRYLKIVQYFRFSKMKANPLVSVVIPAYNASKWISETLNSVLAQDFKDFEVIVVDDGSIDNTQEIVSAFGEKVIYIHKQNGGTGSARNVGIRAAKGKYVAFIDADDLWMTEKLRKQVDLLITKDLAWVYSDAIAFDNQTGQILFKFGNVRHQYEGDILLPLFFVDFVPSPTPVVQKTVFEAVGYFDEGNLKNTEDYDMWLRIAAYYPIGLVSNPLARYRVHSTSKTGIEDPQTFLDQEIRVIDRAVEREPVRLKHYKNRRMAISYYRAAGIYARKDLWKEARQMYGKSIHVSPGFAKAYIGWGASIFDGLLWKIAYDLRKRLLWRR